jgi:perosamine synthetase
VVHPMGSPANVHALQALCERFDVPLVEDAAGALGATCNGTPVGALGRVGIFSFNGNKIVTAGGGGMLVTHDQALAERARNLSTQSRRSDRYWHDEPAFNYRMTNLNAAVGVAQLERLEEMMMARARINSRYADKIAGRSDISMAPHGIYGQSNYWLTAIRVASEHTADDLSQHLRKARIDGRTFWSRLSLQPAYIGSPHFSTGVSAALTGTVLTLPSGSQLTTADQRHVLDTLSSWRGTDVAPLSVSD